MKRAVATDVIASRERKRIRRAIAPALKELRSEIKKLPYGDQLWMSWLRKRYDAIDAATRAPRKGRAR